MKIVFNELEVERALEVYLNSLYSKPVKVLGFDLSGMRAASGLVAMVEIEVEGEVVKQSIPMVQEKKEEPVKENKEEDTTEPGDKARIAEMQSKPQLNKEQLEVYSTILGLINDNPLNQNHKQIVEILDANQDDTVLFDWLNSVEGFKNWKELEPPKEDDLEEPESDSEVISEEVVQTPYPINEIASTDDSVLFEHGEEKQSLSSIIDEVTEEKKSIELPRRNIFGEAIGSTTTKLGLFS